MREREGLIARIRQISRSGVSAQSSAPPAVQSNSDVMRALEGRVAHLEQLVQGLQDSVHRESMRLSKRVGELESRIEPSALARSLSDDARDRGL